MDFKEEFLGLSTKIKFKILRIGFFGQLWPLKFNFSQQAISENFMYNLIATLRISCILNCSALFLILNKNKSFCLSHFKEKN
jgi:hypothetical protein